MDYYSLPDKGEERETRISRLLAPSAPAYVIEYWVKTL